MTWPHHRLAALLLGLYAALFAVTAFRPYDLTTWALENAIAIAGVAGLVVTRNRFPFSRLSYALIFAFLALHTVGAHYTYSLVPYDAWFHAIFGRSLSDLVGWERNHYDRLVHLLYGLLLAYPMREVFVRVAGSRGFWGYFLPFQMTMSTSMVYELIEWAAALVFGGDTGQSYVGTQGDEWDAQKDMALATVGAVVSLGVVAAINACCQRDFAREWVESLRIKREQPLGEDRWKEMRENRPET